ncbi:hypothetical protein PG994_013542 [Apiospora phragmitis]|uniref:Uncharacterized protein n=1 Tax=Apiospora phragmitis TaxID=2905665 RepID=A0ABR1T8Y8_9PEZI
MDISVSFGNESCCGGECDFPDGPLPPKNVLLRVRTDRTRPLSNSGGKIRSAIKKQPRPA